MKTSLNILVVEDEPDVQCFLETSLTDAGFTVTTASDGHEAYNKVKANIPDCITLDLVMPRQSGILFYKKLRKNSKWSKIPVIIISAHTKDDLGHEDYIELMKGAEFSKPDGYLEKPIETGELLKTISELLNLDASKYFAENAADQRAEIMAKLRNIDLGTLEKVRDVLKNK